ncbi:hypothetical protein [Fibrella arboris]|uniref:hypothetical protein n=1 Tax=Fibrella arboris TaxID=3242486 RepID=UPI003522FBE5
MMRFLFTLVWGSLLLVPAHGQSTSRDSTGLTRSALAVALARHDQVSTTPEHLYDGPEYISYDRRLTGHAYYPNDTMQQGQITYKGTRFDVPMLYDIVKDVLIVVHYSGYRLALHSDQVQTFTYTGHTFIRLDSAAQGMPSGFYDVLYNGPTQLLARYKKEVLVNPTSFGYGIFNPKTTYYLRKNGQYVQIRTKRAILALLEDRRKQLATYSRQQKLKFRPSPVAAFLKLAQQYDALTNSL